MDKTSGDVISHLSNKAGFYWQIRETVYLSCDENARLRPRILVPFHCPGKASQGDSNQIVPITDTGGQVE